MPRQPVQFRFTNIAQPAATEVAARRRMRGLEDAYPAILQWDLHVEALEHADPQGRFVATTHARIAGGDLLAGQARGGDPLGAVRLAFNGLEPQLEAGRLDARSRAAQWLNVVKRRLADRIQPD